MIGSEESIEVAASVLTVRYPRAEADDPAARVWRIIATDKGICKGVIAWRPRPGERIRFASRRRPKMGWQLSTYSGSKEFCFETATCDIPVNERALLEYACGLTPGMGPAMAEAIWAARGDGWRGVAAGEVPRFTALVAAAFSETVERLEAQGDEARAVAFVTSFGVSRRTAEEAWAKWGTSTIPNVSADVYRLVSLPRVAFCDIDRHAMRELGYAPDDTRRIDAGISHAMRELCAESTVTSWPELRDACLRLLGGVSAQSVSDRVKKMFGDGVLAAFTERGLIARRDDADAERDIFQFVTEEGF